MQHTFSLDKEAQRQAFADMQETHFMGVIISDFDFMQITENYD